MIWHPFNVTCPDCGQEMETTHVSFRADGMVAVEGRCENCDHFTDIRVPVEEVLANCRNLDNPQNMDFNLENFRPKGRAN